MRRSKFSLAFVASSRADYGIVRRYLRMLDSDNDIGLSILVTGALLSREYGHQVDLIYEDGFTVGAEIDISPDSSSNESIIHSMSIALDKFGKHFFRNKYDLVIILGDRFEMMSAALAAAMNRIPILHLHGGEATFANYDEFIRHCITKMSTYHFTSTEEYRKRVIQLGENPEKVFYLGALGAENCLFINENEVPEDIRSFSSEKYFVVIYNPETLHSEKEAKEQIEELLCAIDEEKDCKFVIIGSNADTYSNIIRGRIREYVSANENLIYYENLSTNNYHYLLKKSLGLIGNSSSGLIEAPSLGVMTINIGDRQAGRIRGNSVIDIKCEKLDILGAIEMVLAKGKAFKIDNPYYRKNTAREYYQHTKLILERHRAEKLKYKVFYDLPNIGDTLDKFNKEK